MKVCQEIREAIDHQLYTMEQRPEFKKRFDKVVENYFKNSIADSDLLSLIDLAQVDMEKADED